MTDSIKASRTTIQIGFFSVDGFMLPDGSYRMSHTQTAEAKSVILGGSLSHGNLSTTATFKPKDLQATV